MAFITNGSIHIINDDKIYDESLFISVSLSETYPNTILALDSKGCLWMKDTTDEFELIEFPSSISFMSISCGYNIIIALDSEGYLWIWNRNDFLSRTNLLNGKSSLETRFIFACCEFHIAAIDEDGNLWSSQYIESPKPFETLNDPWNEDLWRNFIPVDKKDDPVNISGIFKSQNINFISCSCDNHATIALDDNGQLWIYGRRDYEIFPTDNIYEFNRIYICSENTFTSLSSQCGNTIALDKDGVLWALGNNIFPDSVVDDDDPLLGSLTKINFNFICTSATVFNRKVYLLDTTNKIWTCNYSQGVQEIITSHFEIPYSTGDVLFNQFNTRKNKLPIKSAATLL